MIFSTFSVIWLDFGQIRHVPCVIKNDVQGEATPDKPAKKCKHGLLRLGLRFWPSADRVSAGDVFFISSERPAPGEAGLHSVCRGTRIYEGTRGSSDSHLRPSKGFAAESLPCVISPWPALRLPRVSGRKIYFAPRNPSPAKPRMGRKSTRETLETFACSYQTVPVPGEAGCGRSPVKRLRHSPGTGRKSAIFAPLVALCAPSLGVSPQ